MATIASVPARLIETPEAPVPACSVAITAGGDARRSITDRRLSYAVFFGSAGSIFVDAVTSAIDSSGATATLDGGPMIDVGTLTSPTTLGAPPPRSMTVTLSGGGFRIGVLTPSTTVSFASLAETASCASAGAAHDIPTTSPAAILERLFMAHMIVTDVVANRSRHGS